MQIFYAHSNFRRQHESRRLDHQRFSFVDPAARRRLFRSVGSTIDDECRGQDGSGKYPKVPHARDHGNPQVSGTVSAPSMYSDESKLPLFPRVVALSTLAGLSRLFFRRATGYGADAVLA